MDYPDQVTEDFIRAFWRRIEMYKNDYGAELPEKLPPELKAAFLTSAFIIDAHYANKNEVKYINLQGMVMSESEARDYYGNRFDSAILEEYTK